MLFIFSGAAEMIAVFESSDLVGNVFQCFSMFCFRDLKCLLITLLCFDPFFTLLCLSHIDRYVRLCPFLKWGEGQWICSWSPRRWFVGPWSCSNPDITSACSACRQRRPAGHVMPVSVWPIVLLQFASAPLARLLLSSVIVDQDSTLANSL